MTPPRQSSMPDLNSVPASPHALAASRQQSSSSISMPPPPIPTSPSLNILPSNQSAVNQQSSSSALPSPQLPPPSGMASVLGDNTGVGPGPGPLRHPRPMTAAELHLQLEKEQEAVVCMSGPADGGHGLSRCSCISRTGHDH